MAGPTFLAHDMTSMEQESEIRSLVGSALALERAFHDKAYDNDLIMARRLLAVEQYAARIRERMREMRHLRLGTVAP